MQCAGTSGLRVAGGMSERKRPGTPDAASMSPSKRSRRRGAHAAPSLAAAPLCEGAPCEGAPESDATASDEAAADTGGGGCVAHALFELGVFDSVAIAMQRLNFAASRLAGKHLSLRYVADDWWPHEAIAKAVKSERWHMSKIKLGSERLDLAAQFARRSCGHLVDGVLNNEWQDDEGVLVNDATYEGAPPSVDRAAWRHAVAVQGGVILEQHEQRILVKWLWLDGNKPDKHRGYLREILKVYKIWRCTSVDGCRGKGGVCST